MPGLLRDAVNQPAWTDDAVENGILPAALTSGPAGVGLPLLWTLLAVGGLAAAPWSPRLWRSRPAKPRPPATPPDPRRFPPLPRVDPLALRNRVRASPWDGAAHFLLGIHLVQAGASAKGADHLARAFRVLPEGALRLLEDPELAPVRDDAEVRRVLKRLHQDQLRRVWTGYA